MSEPFVITRDARGSLVHVRERATGECVGCLESALYEIVRALVLESATAADGGGSFPGPAAASPGHDTTRRGE